MPVNQCGNMAGRDADRLSDLNSAFRDPNVRAIVTTRGGAGAYRICDQIDFKAVLADPKPLIGFSDITYLHLTLWREVRLPSVHGFLVGAQSVRTAKSLTLAGEPVVVHRDNDAYSARVRQGSMASQVSRLACSPDSMTTKIAAGPWRTCSMIISNP
jgi:muramoyltetrapeptide carboxypeptidase